MPGDDEQREDEGARETALDPIGQALRATWNADNHDSLGRDLTGLMLELARVDDPAPVPVPARTAAAPPSWRQRLLSRLR